jgi:hypothetical protein
MQPTQKAVLMISSGYPVYMRRAFMNLRYTLSFLRILKIPGLYPLMKDWQASIRINFIFAAYESVLFIAFIQPCYWWCLD